MMSYYTEDGELVAAVIQRNGASARTADELCAVFIDDAVSLGVELSPWGRETLRDVNAKLDANRSYGVAWLDDDALRDDLDTLQYQVESDLYTLNYGVEWNDGYVIFQT